MSDILIGTSGYDYPEWRGIFYPAALKRRDFLAYYATVFNALEVNSTFYNMPTSNRIMSFYDRTQGKVSFSIKANRLLTHEITREWKSAADEFRRAVFCLNEKGALSAILVQFPQSFHYTTDNRYYLAALIKAFDGFPVVIEFRHTEWIRSPVFEGLEKMKASLCFCDMPQLKNLPDSSVLLSETKNLTPFIGPQAYIRLHGRNAGAWYAAKDTPPTLPENNGSARYDYEYQPSELREFQSVIRAAGKSKKRVSAYFNNHPRGSGAKNAIQLKELMNEEKQEERLLF